MRKNIFRFRWLALIFSLLFCLARFGRCESSEGNLVEQENGADAGADAKEIEAEEEIKEQSGDSGSGSASEDDATGADLYFYYFDKESLVTESKAPTDKNAKDRPDFLYHPKPGHIRIVEFYAHWCPHCQHFRPKFNEFAKKMAEIAERTELHIDVHAVSCVPHRDICHDFDIHGFPRVKLFLGDNATDHQGIEISHVDLHPFLVWQKIAGKVGSDASAAFAEIGEKEEQYDDNGKNKASASSLSTDAFWIEKTKYEIYCDAYLSFHFAMQHGIFVGRDGPDEKAKETFNLWIELLNKVLPPNWPLQNMLSDIAENIETVLDSEKNLLQIVDRYPPPRKHWSHSCSRGDPAMGYTCGLWQLFHVVTLGVVEWNLAGDSHLSYTPAEVGRTLRDYVDHFFGCEVCRVNFLHEYDDCGFHRCERLATEIGSIEDWKELSLWLFEVHNGVNLRLMKERAETDHRTPTQQELTSAQWPSRNDCPSCWHTDGRFDIDVIYSFLQLTYWPDELLTADKRRDLVSVTGNAKEPHIIEETEDGIESWVFSLVGLIALSVVSWRVQRKREIQRTGKHKKADGDIFV